VIRRLGNITDAVTLRIDRLPVKLYDSMLRLEKSENEFEQGRLSPAVGADYRYELSLIDLG
jgi:hypothetical protein